MLHKEGHKIILYTFLILLIINISVTYFIQDYPAVKNVVIILSVFFLFIILQFFRNPKRNIPYNDGDIIAPADGKVVVIEEVEEPEYFKDKRLQISIFMSPINVHVNRYPVSGVIEYLKYHPGLFLVAWHPKSSTDNERTSIVIKNDNISILVRQIAGALAKRIVCNAKEGAFVRQGDELGFIKFGSRVDIFLPLGTKVNLKLNQKVRGGETIIANI